MYIYNVKQKQIDMKISNFTTKELKEYYNNNETIFFNYKRVFVLDYSNNAGFFFYELTSKRIYNGMPYTRKGKFHACSPEWKTTKEILND